MFRTRRHVCLKREMKEERSKNIPRVEPHLLPFPFFGFHSFFRYFFSTCHQIPRVEPNFLPFPISFSLFFSIFLFHVPSNSTSGATFSSVFNFVFRFSLFFSIFLFHVPSNFTSWATFSSVFNFVFRFSLFFSVFRLFYFCMGTVLKSGRITFQKSNICSPNTVGSAAANNTTSFQPCQ